jgi:hypothetical protein
MLFSILAFLILCTALVGMVGLLGGLLFPRWTLEVAAVSGVGLGAATLVLHAGDRLLDALPPTLGMGAVAFCITGAGALLGAGLRNRTKES